jgi:hypothetical protein
MKKLPSKKTPAKKLPAEKPLVGTTIANNVFYMTNEYSKAAEAVTEALLVQAKANHATAEALLALAGTVRASNMCAIKVNQE